MSPRTCSLPRNVFCGPDLREHWKNWLHGQNGLFVPYSFLLFFNTYIVHAALSFAACCTRTIVAGWMDRQCCVWRVKNTADRLPVAIPTTPPGGCNADYLTTVASLQFPPSIVGWVWAVNTKRAGAAIEDRPKAILARIDHGLGHGLITFRLIRAGQL